MEILAPDRQETSNGFFLSPNFFPVVFSKKFMACWPCRIIPFGKTSPSSMNFLQASVVNVKPGGTEISRRVISARLAPFPPSNPPTSFQRPPTYSNACSTSLKRYTHFLFFIKSFLLNYITVLSSLFIMVADFRKVSYNLDYAV